MIKFKDNISSRLMLALITVVLAACGSSADDELSRYIATINARPAHPIQPIPAFVPIEKFVYPENNPRRSPFTPKEVEKIDDRLAPNVNRPKEPLEEFPLDALKFVGILKQGSIIWGLISEPGGKVARVKVGNYMGKDFGKVISIKRTSLTIEETVQIAGKWEKKLTTFNLNASE